MELEFFVTFVTLQSICSLNPSIVTDSPNGESSEILTIYIAVPESILVLKLSCHSHGKISGPTDWSLIPIDLVLRCYGYSCI